MIIFKDLFKYLCTNQLESLSQNFNNAENYLEMVYESDKLFKYTIESIIYLHRVINVIRKFTVNDIYLIQAIDYELQIRDKKKNKNYNSTKFKIILSKTLNLVKFLKIL